MLLALLSRHSRSIHSLWDVPVVVAVAISVATAVAAATATSVAVDDDDDIVNVKRIMIDDY